MSWTRRGSASDRVWVRFRARAADGAPRTAPGGSGGQWTSAGSRERPRRPAAACQSGRRTAWSRSLTLSFSNCATNGIYHFLKKYRERESEPDRGHHPARLPWATSFEQRSRHAVRLRQPAQRDVFHRFKTRSQAIHVRHPHMPAFGLRDGSGAGQRPRAGTRCASSCSRSPERRDAVKSDLCSAPFVTRRPAHASANAPTIAHHPAFVGRIRHPIRRLSSRRPPRQSPCCSCCSLHRVVWSTGRPRHRFDT